MQAEEGSKSRCKSVEREEKRQDREHRLRLRKRIWESLTPRCQPERGSRSGVAVIECCGALHNACGPVAVAQEKDSRRL